MKEAILRNEDIEVKVSTLGGQLRSILCGARQYLWQGDPAFWGGRAPNLFPYIARLSDGTYTYEGKAYHLPNHGFLPRTEMALEDISDSEKIFVLTDSPETRAVYPFAFELRISYKLEGSSIKIGFSVKNRGERPMHFGIGGHPGFNVPLDGRTAFEDYYLEFAEPCHPKRVIFTDRLLVSGEEPPYELENGKVIRLNHGLFDRDAIVLHGASRSVTLKSDKTTASVTVEYPDMPYIGFWQIYKPGAPYLCIEPWSSLPSRDGITEDLATQPNLITLPGGRHYTNNWRILLGN
jgi:galactose mutarotase-like enzyme